MDKWVLIAVWWVNGGSGLDFLPRTAIVARDTEADCWDYIHYHWAPNAFALARKWERQGVQAGFMYTCTPMSESEFKALEAPHVP